MNHSVGISGYNSNKDVQMCSQFRGDRIQNDIKEHFLNTSRMHGPDSVIHPCVLKHHASEPVPRLACMFSLYLKNNIFPTYKPAWVQPNPMKDNFQSFQMSSYWCNLFFSSLNHSSTPNSFKHHELASLSQGKHYLSYKWQLIICEMIILFFCPWYTKSIQKDGMKAYLWAPFFWHSSQTLFSLSDPTP